MGLLVIRPALTDDEASGRPPITSTTSAATESSAPADADESNQAVAPIAGEATDGAHHLHGRAAHYSRQQRTGRRGAHCNRPIGHHRPRHHHRTGDHRPRGDHRAGDHRTGDHRTGDHRTGDHRAARTATEPATTEPATTEPATTEPATTEPATHRTCDHRTCDHRTCDHRTGDAPNLRRTEPATHRTGDHRTGDHRGGFGPADNDRTTVDDIDHDSSRRPRPPPHPRRRRCRRRRPRRPLRRRRCRRRRPRRPLRRRRCRRRRPRRPTTSTTLPPTTTTTLPPTTTSTTLPPTTSTTTSTTLPPTTTTALPPTTTTALPPTTTSTTLPPATTTTTPPATTSTLPDGRPVVATLTFSDDQVTLTGAVPSNDAASHLHALALDYRLTPATVVDNLTVDADLPADAGVRIVEHNSVHFVDDADSITPEHAQQLDRIVGLMGQFPAVEVHVVGNTDQRGEETRNFVVSQRRADAVVNYLVAQGVDPLRLTTQPAGESNPLSTEVERDRGRAQPPDGLRGLRPARLTTADEAVGARFSGFRSGEVERARCRSRGPSRSAS